VTGNQSERRDRSRAAESFQRAATRRPLATGNRQPVTGYRSR